MWPVFAQEGNKQENYNYSLINFDHPSHNTMYTENIVGNATEIPQSLLVIDSHNIETKPSQLQLLTPPLSCSDLNIPNGTVVPPDLPKMFLDLLVPVQGLKSKKLPYDCSLCGDRFATWNSLVTHNKSHRRPACLACGSILPSASKLASHKAYCQGNSDAVVITSKYGRSRPVKSYLAKLT